MSMFESTFRLSTLVLAAAACIAMPAVARDNPEDAVSNPDFSDIMKLGEQLQFGQFLFFYAAASGQVYNHLLQAIAMAVFHEITVFQHLQHRLDD